MPRACDEYEQETAAMQPIRSGTLVSTRRKYKWFFTAAALAPAARVAVARRRRPGGAPPTGKAGASGF
jgi:hypothetical protein